MSQERLDMLQRVPLMLHIPWESLSSSFARERYQSSLRSGWFIRSLYSVASPVFSSMIAAAKCTLYAHSSIYRLLLTVEYPLEYFPFCMSMPGESAVSFAESAAIQWSPSFSFLLSCWITCLLCPPCGKGATFMLDIFQSSLSNSLSLLDSHPLDRGPGLFLFSEI